MRSHLITICVVMLACRSAVADDPVAPVAEGVKPREIQLNDIITVVMDRPSDTKELAESQRTGQPPFTGCAASVVNIRPNGNLEIESRTEIMHNGEYWERSLTGVVRPKTLRADRTVHSNDIAECRINTSKKGAVNQGSNPLAAAIHQICPRPDAPYAATPVGLIDSPNATKVAVLRQKEADIAQLQQDVNKLRAETGAEQQILVRVQVMEVSLTKMRSLGFDSSSLTSGYSEMSAADAATLFQILKDNNIAKTLTEPTLLTFDGRPASINTGGSEVPVPASSGAKGAYEYKTTGTQVDIVPRMVGDNRVRMNLRVKLSDVDLGQTHEINGESVPGFRIKQVDTGIETGFGQSVVLSGMTETRFESIKRGFGKVEEVQNQIGTIFIVTPEAAEKVGKVAALPIQPAMYTPK